VLNGPADYGNPGDPDVDSSHADDGDNVVHFATLALLTNGAALTFLILILLSALPS